MQKHAKKCMAADKGVPGGSIISSLHSPTDPSQSDADCAESDGVHKDFVESERTPHDFGCLCGLHTKIALSKD